jgi:hypothetical protein
MASKKKKISKRVCFVLMPITTPIEYLRTYKGDSEHFKHVLDWLFIPAIQKSGLNAIKPIAEGAELIHSRIISNIVSADLVLCDMSIQNPNVFFELGIRTALDLPLCLIRDDLPQNVPFDTKIINNHTYKSALNIWEMDEEITRLSDHIKMSFKGGANTNELWKHFGVSAVAIPPKKGSAEQKLSLLTSQVDSLSQQLQSMRSQQNMEAFEKTQTSPWMTKLSPTNYLGVTGQSYLGATGPSYLGVTGPSAGLGYSTLGHNAWPFMSAAPYYSPEQKSKLIEEIKVVAAVKGAQITMRSDCEITISAKKGIFEPEIESFMRSAASDVGVTLDFRELSD